jgi:hypothetical protein
VKTEDHLRRHRESHPNGGWIEYTDFYQEILETCGEDLWLKIPSLLAQPSHDIRCCGLVAVGVRRPESTEAMLLIAPFMRDPHPLVRLTAFNQLLSFSWVEKHVEQMAFDIQQDERLADDQVPRVMAIRLLLKADFAKYRGDLTPELEVIHDLEFGESMVTDLVMEAYRECGGW